MMHPDLRELAATAAADDWPGRSLGRQDRTDWLYGWYLHREPLPRLSGPPHPTEVVPAAALRAAHVGVGRFTGGWRAADTTPSGRVIAERNGDARHLAPGEYLVPARPGSVAQPGDHLLVSGCWDWMSDDEFFWYARGGAWPPDGADRLIRVYWNCAPHDAAALVAEVTATVHGVTDYHLKTALPMAHGGRADGAVLYLGPDAFEQLHARLTAAADDLQPVLRTTVPRLTARIAPGVGWAEGPLDGDSFGQARAELLAAALDDAMIDATADVDRVAAAIDAAFTRAGLDAEHPHREPAT